ncbi:MAG: cbb3-type cytochrome oxidase assembly protein CcoS [Planctomycetota bacterium]
MSVLYIALPIALLLGGGGLLACLYCIRSGQYDDMDTPAVRMLVEEKRMDQEPPISEKSG